MSTGAVHADEVLDLLNAVAATAKTKEKAAILAAGWTPSVAGVARYTLDPTITYGLDDLTEFRGVQPGEWGFGEGTWDLLDRLAKRQLTGNAARSAVARELRLLSTKSGELLLRILAKDLRCGVGPTTINKLQPGLIPEFPYMRCSALKDVKDLEAFIDGMAIAQEKADGMFANVCHEAFQPVRLTSRQGSEIPTQHLKDLVEAATRVLDTGTISHGELLIERDGQILPRAESNGLLNGVANGTALPVGDRVVLKLWDQIPIEASRPKGRFEIPYADRLAYLKDQLSQCSAGDPISLIETEFVTNAAEAREYFITKLRQGREGMVLKRRAGIWRDTGSSGSPDQVKFKQEESVDLEVTGINPGKPGSKYEGRPGAFACKSACRQLAVDVAVKNDKLRAEVEADPESWVGRIIPVLANQVCAPSDSNPLHSLYLPRMEVAGYREDKRTADTLAQILAKFNSAAECRKGGGV